MNEKLIRSVAMNIREKDGADPIRINVEFDLSNLSREQLADWCTNASSLRVNFQNKVRPKGRLHLIELSKSTQKVVVQPCGTRTEAPLDAERILRHILGVKYDTYVAKFESVDAAYDALKEIMDV